MDVGDPRYAICGTGQVYGLQYRKRGSLSSFVIGYMTTKQAKAHIPGGSAYHPICIHFSPKTKQQTVMIGANIYGCYGYLPSLQ